MAGKSSSYRKNLEFIAKDIGEELIPFLTIEERLRGLSPEEILRGLDSETREKLKQKEKMVRWKIQKMASCNGRGCH